MAAYLIQKADRYFRYVRANVIHGRIPLILYVYTV